MSLPRPCSLRPTPAFTLALACFTAFPPGLTAGPGPDSVAPPAAVAQNRGSPAPSPKVSEDHASQTESMAWRELRLAADRERKIWERLRATPDDDIARKRAETEFRDILTAYENVIRAVPDLAEAYAAYGLLLGRTGNREESIKALLKANKLDPNIAMVKNQLGNFLAEEGNYQQALAYYLAAIELNGEEPLYHYQLGNLLLAYRDFFLDDKTFDRATLDREMQTSFQRAAQLAPQNWGYIYRYAESFYDLEDPDWTQAMSEWRQLETKAPDGLGKQTIRLHEANVLLKSGQPTEAAALLESITEPALEEQKKSVAAQVEDALEG